MWKWLFDAHRLLGVAAEVLDEEFVVLVPSRDGRVLRERFEASRSEPIQPLLAASLTSDGAFVASAGGVRLACAPIVCGGALAGAMLVGTDERSQLEEGDLARLASLLADAIGDQLARPAREPHGHLHQISALYQLLHAAIATGSEAEVIRTFAEALSIWEEIEVLAYRADLDGRYALTVALPGSDPSVAPRLLEHEPVAAGPSLRRLSATEREHLGFGGEGETVLAFLGSDGGRWLIALNSGQRTEADLGWTREAPDRERSEMYVAALGHALNGCVAVETSRLTWAIMQQFIDRDPPVEAAGRALEELSRALAATGSFFVRGPGGYPVLIAGENRSGLQGGLPVTDARILRSQVIIPLPFSATLEVRARAGKGFTPRDLKLFQAAVATFAAWLPSALRRVSGAERRGVVRSFDQIVDRYARESHEARDETSLILISAGEEMLSLDTTHTWIKQLRPQLRPTDLAGRLSSGELGILLLQTPHAGAQIVARRLSRVLAAGAGEERAVRIGVASQLDERVSAEALIARARMHPVDPSVNASAPPA